jgi:putative transposase
MSGATSLGTGRPYGVQRVCRVWNLPRSTFYAGRRVLDPYLQPSRRGPKPRIGDDELLVAIRNDLERSPWQGEGHRKVWKRLQIRDGLPVGRNRVLRLMRENHLLSPHRGRRADADPHDGRISTDEPGIMWGTDGVRVQTVDEGWVWIFTAVEHWNAECVGWHVVKRGDRYAALEPLSMALGKLYGGVEAGVARGLALRMDHGSQYIADHFIKQVAYWGIQPSYAFVKQPQTNGVAERFNRTLKEQLIHGRIHRTIDELREAMGEFVERYNSSWLVEKNGFLSPFQAREAWMASSRMQRAA